MSAASKPSYAYIDCLRGYAVLLVLSAHLAYEFPELPYPAHRLAVMGWNGVQLFFLASCVTLLMSWEFERQRYGCVDVRAFFVRRFLRIAPAYYAAAAFYYILSPPPGGFDSVQFLATLGFVNAWTPALMPTVDGGWYVVPGGWSIGVEFTFYLFFPVIATLVTSRRRALAFLAGSVALALVANHLCRSALTGHVAPVALDNFIYFWFPNQLPVFALGSVLYFFVNRRDALARAAAIARHPDALPLVAVLALVVLAYTNLNHALEMRWPVIPNYLAVCLPFMVFATGLAAAPRSRFINRAAAAMGRVSFSAYLFHFAVIKLLPHRYPEVFGGATTGIAAIAAYAATWLVVVLATFVAASGSYRLIERPMMDLAKQLTRRPDAAPGIAVQKAPS